MSFNHYLSIINNNSNKLLGLISWLTEKQYITNKIQLIFINYLTKKDKEIWEEITKICQQKQVKLKVINYCQNINIYSALKKAIVGDIIVFTHSDYQPEATWLEKIAEPFS